MPRSGWVLGVAALWAPFVGFALFGGDDRVIRFFQDDAFYYLQPAWNFVHDGRSTFDGIHLTNGYHPLNFLLVALLAWGSTKSGLVAVTFAVHSLLAIGACALAVEAFGPRRYLLASLGAFVVVASPAFLLFVYLSMGLEAALVVLCTAGMCVALRAALRREGVSIRSNLVFGVSIALLLLARLDTIIPVAVVLTGFLGVQVAGRGSASLVERVRGMAAVVVVPVVLLGTYLLVNWVTMGHVVPISGHVKGETAFGNNSWHPSTRGSPGGIAITLFPLGMQLAAAGVAAFRIWRRHEPRDTAYAVMLGSLGGVAFYAYLASGVGNVFRWYFAFPIGCAIVGAAYLARLAETAWLTGEPRRRAWAAGVLLAAGVAANLACVAWLGSRTASTAFQLKKVSELVGTWGGARAVTATLDAGVIGYFAPGRVINLDGLANDFDYLEQYLRRGRVHDYLLREGVTHLLVRDGTLANADEVARGDYRLALFTLAPRLSLAKDQELFRYTIPGQFTVYYFRMPDAPPTR